MHDEQIKRQKIYSNTSKLLGMDISFADSEQGILEANFTTREQFLNFTDHIHGGILVTMLDDLMGYALGITLAPNVFAHTANLNVSFLRPATQGVLHGRGEVLKKTADIYSLAAKLYNDSNQLVAAGTAKARVISHTNQL